MNIKTYSTSSPSFQVVKRLINEKTIDITCKSMEDINAPLIVLTGAIPTFNYVYIPSFNRYYFVNDVTKGNNDTYMIQLNIDRLMTYKDNILSSYGVVKRSENNPNNYINDGSWGTDVRRTTHIINYSQGFNDEPEYILMTCGDTL